MIAYIIKISSSANLLDDQFAWALWGYNTTKYISAIYIYQSTGVYPQLEFLCEMWINGKDITLAANWND